MLDTFPSLRQNTKYLQFKEFIMAYMSEHAVHGCQLQGKNRMTKGQGRRKLLLSLQPESREMEDLGVRICTSGLCPQ